MIACGSGERARRQRARIAWWYSLARKLSRTFRTCEHCGRPVESWYDPNPRAGLELWSRCSSCGRSTLHLVQPHGERRPFIPPVDYTVVRVTSVDVE